MSIYLSIYSFYYWWDVNRVLKPSTSHIFSWGTQIEAFSHVKWLTQIQHNRSDQTYLKNRYRSAAVDCFTELPQRYWILPACIQKKWMKTSRCGFCYSACRRRERCERQGSPPRCCGVCVLIRLVLLRSFWHFPSTPAPVSLSLSVSASSPGLSQTFSSPTRLSSILCWHRQAAPSVTRLINSCSPILSATAGRARALSHARSRTSSESKFPMHRQPVYTCWHVLKGFFCCLYELLQLQDCLCLSL